MYGESDTDDVAEIIDVVALGVATNKIDGAADTIAPSTFQVFGRLARKAILWLDHPAASSLVFVFIYIEPASSLLCFLDGTFCACMHARAGNKQHDRLRRKKRTRRGGGGVRFVARWKGKLAEPHSPSETGLWSVSWGRNRCIKFDAGFGISDTGDFEFVV